MSSTENRPAFICFMFGWYNSQLTNQEAQKTSIPLFSRFLNQFLAPRTHFQEPDGIFTPNILEMLFSGGASLLEYRGAHQQTTSLPRRQWVQLSPLILCHSWDMGAFWKLTNVPSASLFLVPGPVFLARPLSWENPSSLQNREAMKSCCRSQLSSWYFVRRPSK